MDFRRVSMMLVSASAVFLSGCAATPAAPVDAPVAAQACDVRMSQLGFLPSASKTAILRTPGSEPQLFQVHDSSGAVVAEGRSVPFGENVSSDDTVHQIFLPENLPEGDGYTVSACGGVSHPFSVRADLYADLSEDALRYFYHNRIGTEIKAAFVQGPQWARREVLNPLTATCFSGTDMFGNEWPGCAHELDVTGSWFDAGDFGVYGVNMGVSIWTLQHAYERLKEQGAVESSGWSDGRMQLPETGNGVSELLDEARWGMESLLKLQVPAGGKAWTPRPGAEIRPGKPAEIEEIDAGGLVDH
jgi:endoglucanase